jgi:hypothetical protein
MRVEDLPKPEIECLLILYLIVFYKINLKKYFNYLLSIIWLFLSKYLDLDATKEYLIKSDVNAWINEFKFSENSNWLKYCICIKMI